MVNIFNHRTQVLMFYILRSGYLNFLIIASGSYFFWYVWLGERGKKIDAKIPKLRENIRGVLLSLVSVYIFALCICLPLGNQYFMSNLSVCDLDDESHSWAYIIWSTAILVVLHETYFYWSHRLLHTKFLYNHIHYVHHLARNPTPWSVFLLHPFEAFLQGFFYTLTFLLIPTNWKQLAAFYFAMHLQDMYNHLGYEIYPRNWHRHWLGRWINTAVAHYLHHSGRHGQGNFSFYFLFWDKLMGTEIQQYAKEYERVTGGTAAAKHNSNGKIITNGGIAELDKEKTF